MSLINDIKNRQSQPTVTEARVDILTETTQIAERQAVCDSNLPPINSPATQLDELRGLLARYPEIAKQQPLRLQVAIKEKIDALCQQESITAETLLEALFTIAQAQGTLPNAVSRAQEQLRVRKEMGNLKSRITQLGNLLKHDR
jgi:hypothetical protein